MSISAPSIPEIRAEIARLGILIYQLSARVGVHPGRMSRYLNERVAIPESLARRIWQELEDERQRREVPNGDSD